MESSVVSASRKVNPLSQQIRYAMRVHYRIYIMGDSRATPAQRGQPPTNSIVPFEARIILFVRSEREIVLALKAATEAVSPLWDRTGCSHVGAVEHSHWVPERGTINFI